MEGRKSSALMTILNNKEDSTAPCETPRSNWKGSDVKRASKQEVLCGKNVAVQETLVAPPDACSSSTRIQQLNL